MKKKWTAILLLSVMVLSACGKGAEKAPETADTAENQTEENATAEMEENATAEEEAPASSDPALTDNDDTPITDATIEKDGIEAFLVMPDYEGLELTKEIFTVTDDDVEMEIQNSLQWNPVLLPDDTLIETGMVANIDYEGTIDGVAFDGGSYEGYDLEIGSGSFVEGFEEQLVGHKKGDQFDITVTFPDDYYDELAGKEAVFAITVNEVKQILEEPTDEWAALYTDYDTAEAYLDNVKDDLTNLYNSGSESQVRSQAWEQVVGNASFFQYPKDLYDLFYENTYQSLVVEGAQEAGMTEEEYRASWGIDDDYVAMVTKDALRQELAARYVLMKEGVETDGAEVDAAMDELLTLYGYGNVEDIAATESRKFSFRNSARSYLAAGLIVAKGHVTEKPYEEPEYEFYGEEEENAGEDGAEG